MNESQPNRELTLIRFGELEPAGKNPPDTRLERYRRRRYQVVGRKSERVPGAPGADASIDVNFGYMTAPPGAGNCSHSHPRWEIFIPLSGKWSVAVEGGGLDSRYVLELGAYDMIILPPDVFHEATNISDDEAWMLSINPGNEGEPYSIHPAVIEELRAFSREAAQAAVQAMDI